MGELIIALVNGSVGRLYVCFKERKAKIHTTDFDYEHEGRLVILKSLAVLFCVFLAVFLLLAIYSFIYFSLKGEV